MLITEKTSCILVIALENEADMNKIMDALMKIEVTGECSVDNINKNMIQACLSLARESAEEVLRKDFLSRLLAFSLKINPVNTEDRNRTGTASENKLEKSEKIEE